jgi:hypothetical protein
LPARFLVACDKGHLDDFPWLEFVHRGVEDCNGPLLLYEVGASGEASDVEVKCDRCKVSRRMAEAFGRDNQRNMPACRGRRPHLRDLDPKGCDVPHVQPILQGASNSWFSVMISALSVPQAVDKLAQLVAENWAVLEKAQSKEVVAAFRAIGQLKDFGKYTDDDIWQAVEQKQQGDDQTVEEPSDLKSPEYSVFTNPASAQESRFFKLKTVDPPDDFARFFEKIVLVEKLREVRALIGFTRIDSPRDFDSPLEVPPERRMRLSDPLCAEHDPGSGDKLHGAACHACSFLPETCCERGNKYLDRSVLARTLEREDLAFFG